MGDYRPHWLANVNNNQSYNQVQHWPSSLQPEIKPTTHDSSNTVYTSDYGSYSSQESNHSGNTLYSNIIDCEEILHNLHMSNEPKTSLHESKSSEAYQMNVKPAKPVPPPRIDSRSTLLYANQTQPSLKLGKEKKISFDDSTLNKTDKEEPVTPSYATLPRKKKLANSDNVPSTVSSSATQVTWMKEIAQKEESLRSENTKVEKEKQVPPKQIHGILKNGMKQIKQDEKSSYINRSTVQRILDQQRKVSLHRHVGTSPNSSSLLYKSVPNLTTSVRKTPMEYNQQRPWETSTATHDCSVPTAQVIGVIEPPAVNHMRQGSAETEFEFPPPPSDTDIARILSPESPPGSNLFPSSQEKANPDTDPTVSRRVTSTHSSMFPKQQKERKLPEIFAAGLLKKTGNNNNQSAQPLDIVLPPPPEFQEDNSHTKKTIQHTYGDYELLSPDAQYEAVAPRYSSHPVSYKPKHTIQSNRYSNSIQSTLHNRKNDNKTYYYQSTPALLVTDHPSKNDLYSRRRRINNISQNNHHHQYSTEL